jgi:uncharacterized protein YlxW (UPF0749 family)
MMHHKIAFSLALILIAVPLAAQTISPTSTHHRQTRKPSKPSLEEQINEMRTSLQSQIDDLKARLAARDAQIEALQTGAKSAQDTATATAAKVDAVDTATHENASAVTAVQSSVSTLQAETASTSTSVQQVQTTQAKIQKAVEEPASIHYKGATITPGGFIAGESIWRERAMNADIYTNFNATPYMNSGEAHTSEWVPSARATRPNVLFTGKVPFGTISGFLETDFLSAGTTSNNLQSNSYTVRLRQAWAQLSAGHLKFTGGQMWTLLAEDKKAADPGQEAVPLIFDQNLHVGDTYLRQTGFRFADQVTPKITAAVALESSQYQFSASNAPSNFFFGSAGAAGGLDNPTANYTNQVAPDVIAKVSFDPGHGHYEIGGVARFFRDRYYPGTTAAGAQNDTRLGGGFVANARFPITKYADLGFHLVAGDGTGRYGVSLLPDITVRPNGTLAPIRNAQGLFSLELHPTNKLDLFGYAGTEYAQRTFYTSATGTLVGYAPTSGNNAGCGTEAVPTSGTGYGPGASACLGATRDITQGSAGWVYRIYSGPAGKLQYGVAYSYLTREGWSGVGGAPKATNNFVYTSFRYYIP